MSGSTTAAAEARHFVLVHATSHGAWYWYKLVSLLEAAGQKVTALDLAASGINLVPFDDLKTVDDYHKPLFDYLETLSADDKVILVGHSWGGYGISSAMERFPTKISLAVFVSAFMVGPSLTYDDINKRFYQPGASYGDNIVTLDPSTGYPATVILGRQYMAEVIYQLSPVEDLLLATTLIRICRYFYDDKSKSQLAVTKDKYGTIPRVYIRAAETNALPENIQKWMIESTPPKEVRIIEGADHAVMMSKPKELSQNLLELAKKYA